MANGRRRPRQKNTRRNQEKIKLNKEKKPKNVPRELLTSHSKGELRPRLFFWNSGANPGSSYAPDFCHLPGNFNGHFFAVRCRCCCCCRCCWCWRCCCCRCHAAAVHWAKMTQKKVVTEVFRIEHVNIYHLQSTINIDLLNQLDTNIKNIISRLATL